MPAPLTNLSKTRPNDQIHFLSETTDSDIYSMSCGKSDKLLELVTLQAVKTAFQLIGRKVQQKLNVAPTATKFTRSTFLRYALLTILL